MASDERLPRGDRLRRAREFELVGRVGRRFVSRELVVVVAPAERPREQRRERMAVSRGPRRRLGVTVSRKVGKAVVRNRVKRGIREWFRRCQCLKERGDIDVVVIARPAAGRWRAGEIGLHLSELVQWGKRGCA